MGPLIIMETIASHSGMGGIGKDTTEERGGLRVSTKFKRRPAIAIIASDSDVESVARTLIEANRNGYYPFVVVFDSTDPTISGLARELDAAVLELDSSGKEGARNRVEDVSRALGFPGVLYHEPSRDPIDFSRCDEAVETTDRFAAYAPTVSETDGTMQVVAAIPAYDEVATIADVVTTVGEYVDEVIVVDDGSVDDTADAAERAGATVVEHESNRGYGAALKTAFTEAYHRDVDVLVTLDADGQHDPEDIPKLLRAHRQKEPNVMIGSRFCDDTELYAPLYRRVGLMVVNVLTNLSLGGVRMRSWISDTQSGFRVYDRKAIRSLASTDRIGNGMSASVDILFHAQERNYDIEEVGTSIRYDGDGTSTQHPFLHGVSLISNILKTVERERPLTFLGIPGLITLAVGGGFGYWTVFNYVNQGTFASGIALLCLLFLFLGSLLSIASIILHSLNTHFETLTERTVRGGQ